MKPLFSPLGMYWRINCEWLIALAGPRAVLLELAHPAVAAGVAQHSNYRSDPFGRLYRTMKTMTEISFGTLPERQAALRHFHHCHVAVNGMIESNETASPAPYDARDAHLKFWVLATLIDSVLLTYVRFVAPLSWEEKCAYYTDCRHLARVLGIIPAVIPPTFQAFNLYMDEMVSGETLRVSHDTRAVVDALFARTPRGVATRLFSLASIGMLPPRLRAQYGYSWDDRREQHLEEFARWTRRIRPRIPRALAIHPKARSMERRFARRQTPAT